MEGLEALTSEVVAGRGGEASGDVKGRGAAGIGMGEEDFAEAAERVLGRRAFYFQQRR
jgi:hypothetical protein